MKSPSKGLIRYVGPFVFNTAYEDPVVWLRGPAEVMNMLLCCHRLFQKAYGERHRSLFICYDRCHGVSEYRPDRPEEV